MDALCFTCSNIKLHEIAASEIPSGRPPNGDSWGAAELTKEGYNHLENARDLIKSSKSCAMCALMLKVAEFLFDLRASKVPRNNRKMTEDFFLALPIKLGTQGGFTIPPDGGLALDTLVVAFPFVENRKPQQLPPYVRGPLIGLIATKDSAAALSGDVVGRPHFSSPDSPEAYAYLRERIGHCVRNHTKCAIPISGETVDEALGVRLPTRLIDVGDEQSDDTRLVISKGGRGLYVTLSHCWGPEEMRPIRTLKSNINQHLICIAKDSLLGSRTFRDAIMITREIGLRYLWIDSLCIVQDDSSDWEREAASMGDIFQNSYVTIIAAHAEDATGGCFFNRTLLEDPPVVWIPYIDKQSIFSGLLGIKARLPKIMSEEDPCWCPIRSRAWITQEEYLSRRKVYYTKRNVFWVCQELQVSETGETNYVQNLPRDWVSIVENYTGRKLTYPTDKLIALQGLANAIGRTRCDRYVNGLWLSDFPENLLWFGRYKPQLTYLDELSVPSWSWASRNGNVDFLKLDPERYSRHDNCPISLKDLAKLTLTAPILPVIHVEDITTVPSFTAEEVLSSGITGSITSWLLGSKDAERALRDKSGVYFSQHFDVFMEWLPKIMGSSSFASFGFPSNRTYLIADWRKKAVGFGTLDHDVSAPGEIYYCVPVVQTSKTDPSQTWRIHHCLLLQTTSERLVVANFTTDAVLVRVGVAVTVSQYWAECKLPQEIQIQ